MRRFICHSNYIQETVRYLTDNKFIPHVTLNKAYNRSLEGGMKFS